jgi:hypothetical protein
MEGKFQGTKLGYGNSMPEKSEQTSDRAAATNTNFSQESDRTKTSTAGPKPTEQEQRRKYASKSEAQEAQSSFSEGKQDKKLETPEEENMKKNTGAYARADAAEGLEGVNPQKDSALTGGGKSPMDRVRANVKDMENQKTAQSPTSRSDQGRGERPPSKDSYRERSDRSLHTDSGKVETSGRMKGSSSEFAAPADSQTFDPHSSKILDMEMVNPVTGQPTHTLEGKGFSETMRDKAQDVSQKVESSIGKAADKIAHLGEKIPEKIHNAMPNESVTRPTSGAAVSQTVQNMNKEASRAVQDTMKAPTGTQTWTEQGDVLKDHALRQVTVTETQAKADDLHIPSNLEEMAERSRELQFKVSDKPTSAMGVEEPTKTSMMSAAKETAQKAASVVSEKLGQAEDFVKTQLGFNESEDAKRANREKSHKSPGRPRKQG